jgi:tRNA threonylcarbamoyladenosine biosynthesis protein TsaE
MEKSYIKFIPDESSMLAFGKQLARVSLHHMNFNFNKVIFLHGQLGAGKTTLVRGFLFGLGHEGRVKSPTYTLVEPYELSACTVFHFDLYRLHHPHELESIGVQDYFIPKAICLIEWPEQGGSLLPLPDLACHIKMQNHGREIKLIAQSADGEIILQRLQHEK